MLLSMTGFGEARCQRDGLATSVEVRTINSRFLKLSVRAGEGYASLEPQIEAIVRKTIRRGTIQVNLRIDRARSPEDYKINVEILKSYQTQLEQLSAKAGTPGNVPVETLLELPGVVEENTLARCDAAADWPLIRSALEKALESLAKMRAKEGLAMAADMVSNCHAAAASLEIIEKRAPLVVEDYGNRLRERLNKMLAEFEVVVEPTDLIKEVSLFADRGDVSEEIVRLRSHLEQFETSVNSREASGRKLEFLSQEMFREANTIGSKANDLEIARCVIDIKAAIERIREMIQNIE
ncbi:MAG: YicC/YloC family endoribonuclease [Thermoguttaceae bacterium]